MVAWLVRQSLFTHAAQMLDLVGYVDLLASLSITVIEGGVGHTGLVRGWGCGGNVSCFYVGRWRPLVVLGCPSYSSPRSCRDGAGGALSRSAWARRP
jgi:hypothetical protein